MIFKIKHGRYDPEGAKAHRAQNSPECPDYTEYFAEYEDVSLEGAMKQAKEWCDNMTNCGIEHIIIGPVN